MNKTNTIDSISNFFTISPYQYHIFDMGHTVYQLSQQQFKRIEAQQEAYPTPFKQEAWLGILFWQPRTKHTPVIWFIHLPIDEMGLLKLETRDHFIQQTLEQVGEKITHEHKANQQQHLADVNQQSANSPFAFKPNQEKMAIFNALAKKILHQPPSHYYDHVVHYLAGKIGYEQWSFLGLQGIADVVVRLDSDATLQNHLLNALPKLPEIPLTTFAHLLEHSQPTSALSIILLECLEKAVMTSANNTPLHAALLRALSSAQTAEHRQQALQLISQQNKIDNIEILAVIASRFWRDLADQALLKIFLNALANHPQVSFDHLLLSLMTLPALQKTVRQTLKQTNHTQEPLATRIAHFIQGVR